MGEQVASEVVRAAATRGDDVFLVLICLGFCLALTTLHIVKMGRAVELITSAVDKLVTSADKRAEQSFLKMDERALEDRRAHESELRLLREIIAENNRVIGRNTGTLETAARHWSVPKNGG